MPRVVVCLLAVSCAAGCGALADAASPPLVEEGLVEGGEMLGTARQALVDEDGCFSRVPPFIGLANNFFIGVDRRDYTPTSFCSGNPNSHVFRIQNYDERVFGPPLITASGATVETCADFRLSYAVSSEPLDGSDSVVARGSRRGSVEDGGASFFCDTSLLIENVPQDGDYFIAVQVLQDLVDGIRDPLISRSNL